MPELNVEALSDAQKAAYEFLSKTTKEMGAEVEMRMTEKDGTINVSEYNNPWSSASGMEGDYGFRSGVPTGGLVFIHFDQRAW